MAYVSTFEQVRSFLAGQRAQLVKRSHAGDVYVTDGNQYVRVVRNGSGYNLDVFRSRSECGCG